MFSVNNSLLCGFMSSVIRIWKTDDFSEDTSIDLKPLELDESSCCIMSIIEHKNNLWVAISNLIVELNSESFTTNWKNSIKLPRTIVCMSSDGSKNIWIATDRVLSVWNTEEKSCLLQITPEQRIFTIVQTKNFMLITGWNACIQVWEKVERKLAVKLGNKQEFGVRCMIIISENPLIICTGSYDKTICLWTT